MTKHIRFTCSFLKLFGVLAFVDISIESICLHLHVYAYALKIHRVKITHCKKITKTF